MVDADHGPAEPSGADRRCRAALRPGPAACWQVAAPRQVSSEASPACSASTCAGTASGRCSSARTDPSGGRSTRARRRRTRRRRHSRCAAPRMRSGCRCRGGQVGSWALKSGPWCSTSAERRQSLALSPRSSGTRLCPSTFAGTRAPPSWPKVGRGRRSRRSPWSSCRPALRARRRSSGTLMSVSNAVILPWQQPVVAQVEAVVRAEHDVGVPVEPARLQRVLDAADHVVDGLNRLRSLAEQRVEPRDLGRRERRVTAEPARRAGVRHVEVARARRLQPGKSFASRGAGVAGGCGAKVASSIMNGLWASAERLMKSTALPAITSVR